MRLVSVPEGDSLGEVPADAEDRRRIIAFSLWGSNPRYLRGALHNALLAPSIFPDWTCRFYVDSSVDQALVAALRSLGERNRHDRRRTSPTANACAGGSWSPTIPPSAATSSAIAIRS